MRVPRWNPLGVPYLPFPKNTLIDSGMELYRLPRIDGAKISEALAASSAAVLRLGHDAMVVLLEPCGRPC